MNIILSCPNCNLHTFQKVDIVLSLIDKYSKYQCDKCGYSEEEFIII